MKVQLFTPNYGQTINETIDWPEDWPLPSEGESVVPSDGYSYRVKNVSYQLTGDNFSEGPVIRVIIAPPFRLSIDHERLLEEHPDWQRHGVEE